MNKPKGLEPTIFFIDGGSRGNPGPAGYGVVVKNFRDETIESISGFIGVRTNNVAEYSGLLAALEFALLHGFTHVRVFSDSELLVKQMKGEYRVKSPDLHPLFTRAKGMAAKIPRFEIQHVRREFNRAADALANKAMDRGPSRKSLPSSVKFRAIVENGLLRPLTEVPLPENQIVECTFRTES